LLRAICNPLFGPQTFNLGSLRHKGTARRGQGAMRNAQGTLVGQKQALSLFRIEIPGQTIYSGR